MSTMRGPEIGVGNEAARARRGPPQRLMVVVALAMILGLGVAWAILGQPASVPPLGNSSSGNLLVNGSFEQPAGGLLTFGHSWSWWQRFQMWYRINSDLNRIAISRRQRPVFFPFPPPPPELTGWRLTRGTVDVVGPGYWQSAPGQGNQSLDLIGSPGAGTIEQTFVTEPGREYRFSGWLSHNPVIDPSPVRRANVYLNDRFFVQLGHGDPKTTRRNMCWKRFSYRFRALTSRTTLKLEDVTTATGSPQSREAVQLCGTVLDGLSVTPVASSRPRQNPAR